MVLIQLREWYLIMVECVFGPWDLVNTCKSINIDFSKEDALGNHNKEFMGERLDHYICSPYMGLHYHIFTDSCLK